MKKTILIVDDEEFIRETLISYLEDNDFDVYAAEDAESGLKLLNQPENPINLVIMDVRLPGMNGNEAVEKYNKKNSSLKFILYTGSVEYRLPERLKKIGLDEKTNLMYKPIFELNTILDKINFLIQ